MIDRFEEKFSKLLKKQAESINPESFLLANVAKSLGVTSAPKMRYNFGKERLIKINELMNQKLKVLAPIAAIVLVIAGGLAYQASRVATPASVSNSPGNASPTTASSSTTDQQSSVQSSGDPDQIYNQLINDSSDEATVSESSDSDWSEIDSYNQSVEQLNNAYDENQF